MGSMQDILGMLPGVNSSALKNVDIDEKKLAHIEAIITSMTLRERELTDKLTPSRKERIAKGSGTSMAEVNALIKQFEQMQKMMKQLSGGMQQRVGLARALANDPAVLLMDEAFSALDPLIRVQMQDEWLALHSKMKKTILFITHDLEEAIKLGDRIAIMRDGEIQQIGTSEEILTEPANDYVKCFVENVDRSRIVTASSIMADKPLVARWGKEGPEVLIRKMKERKLTVLPVVDADGILMGEVRLKDLVRLRKERVLTIDSVVRNEVHSVLGDTVVEDILPSRRLASLSLTMVYFITAPAFTFLISTVESICTTSLRSLVASMILASAIVALRLLIFISSMACASLAASYSEFSDRSPLSRASAMAADAAGRSMVSILRSWATILS